MQNQMPALDFDDIFDIWLPPWWQDSRTWLVIASVILCSAVLMYLVSMWRRRKQPLDPRVEALQCLYALVPSRVFDTQEEYKQFYVELTTLIKRYLDRQYHLACVSKTDIELVGYLERHAPDTRYQAVVQDLMRHASPVKFAQATEQYDTVLVDYEKVLDLVRKPIDGASKS